MNTIYLVTGAAGLLGNNIVLSLIKEGKQVRALVLDGDPAIEYIPDNVDIFIGDVADIESLNCFFSVPEDTEIFVIHCASIVSLSPLPNQRVYDVNVNGTQNIVDLCVENQIKKLVYVSSTGAITELPKDQTIYEPSSFAPDLLVGYYSKTKALATEIVLKAVNEKNLNASIVYPSGICGPNDYSFGPVAQFIMNYCEGKMSIGFEGFFNSVDVRDLANGIIKCTEKDGKSEGYIMSNEVMPMQRLFQIISDASGHPLVETILPVDLMIKQTTQNIPDGPNKEKEIESLKFGLYNMVRNNTFSSEKAKSELGYQTRVFDETISDEVNWLIKIGKINRYSA